MKDLLTSKIPLVAAAGGVIGQIAMVTEDIRAAMDTWGGAEDGQAWRVWEYGPEMIARQTYNGEESQYSMFLAMRGSHPQLEFVQPLNGPSIYHTWIDEQRSGIHHLGFYVDDLDSVTPLMEAAGYRCVMTGEGHGADGSGKFAYYDTCAEFGFYLEGIEVPSARREPLYSWPQEENGGAQ